jgi:hypothetical protein
VAAGVNNVGIYSVERKRLTTRVAENLDRNNVKLAIRRPVADRFRRPDIGNSCMQMTVKIEAAKFLRFAQSQSVLDAKKRTRRKQDRVARKPYRYSAKDERSQPTFARRSGDNEQNTRTDQPANCH